MDKKGYQANINIPQFRSHDQKVIE